MPTLYQMISELEKSRFTWDVTKLEVKRYAYLLPTDENGEVSFGKGGKYRSPATLTFPNAIIRALTSLWSFEVEATIPVDSDGISQGSIDFQISNNGGTTYYYWNAGWVVAGANDWSSEYDVQNNIANFPFAVGLEKQIRIKARLNPSSDMTYTPYLIGISVHHELDFIPEVDVLESLFAHIENNITVETNVSVVLGAAASNFIPNIDAEIMSVVGAYNITTDPGKQTNIFLSLSKTLVQTNETGEKIYSQLINLTASQPINSEIKAIVKLKIYPYVAPDADYVFSTLPKFLVELGDHGEDARFRDDGHKVEKNKAKRKARIRQQALTYRMPIRIMSYSPDELLAIEMNRALIRAFTFNSLLSLATAEEFRITNQSEFATANIAREDLSVKRYLFSVIYYDWVDNTYQEVPLVETFQIVVDEGGRYEG